jgi:hypothetical protein
MPLKFDKVEGIMVEKRVCMFILACFFVLVHLIVGPVNSAAVHFMCGILSTSQCR